MKIGCNKRIHEDQFFRKNGWEFCGQPAILFYLVRSLNSGKEFYKARCGQHSQEPRRILREGLEIETNVSIHKISEDEFKSQELLGA